MYGIPTDDLFTLLLNDVKNKHLFEFYDTNQFDSLLEHLAPYVLKLTYSFVTIESMNTTFPSEFLCLFHEMATDRLYLFQVSTH